jgi:hypothetical protein
MSETYTLEQIREMVERVTADGYEIDYEGAEELEYAIGSELMEDKEISANALRAGLQILESNWKIPLTASQFTAWWEDHYRKAWPSKAAYAEYDTRELHMTDDQARLLEYLGEHIDWAGLGDSYAYSDHTFIELDDEFHVFRG